MKIFTSYFANLKKIPPGIVPVSIALWKPKWYTGLEYTALAPTKQILLDWKQNQDQTEYVRRYTRDVLSRLNPEQAVSDLAWIAGEEVVLMCYEKSRDFCHRNLVAAWLVKNGILAREI